MKILGFDLASLFRAPVVTEEPEIPDPQTPMPVEYNEIDTTTDLWDDNIGPQEPEAEECDGETIHEMMYKASAPPACTIKRDAYDEACTPGGSENFQGGSEEIHK